MNAEHALRNASIMAEHFQRYARERAALAEHEGEMIDVTRFGNHGYREFIDTSPTARDYAALAERAYLRGDLTIEEFEAELDTIMGLA